VKDVFVAQFNIDNEESDEKMSEDYI